MKTWNESIFWITSVWRKKDIKEKWRKGGKNIYIYIYKAPWIVDTKGVIWKNREGTEIAESKAAKMCRRSDSNFRRQNGSVSSFARAICAINYSARPFFPLSNLSAGSNSSCEECPFDPIRRRSNLTL